MKKAIILLITFIFASSFATALASPLNDYSQGKATVDLTWRDSHITMNGNMPVLDLDTTKGYNLDSAVTIGLGNNWAIQCRAFRPNAPINNAGFIALNYEYNEYNILRKVGKGISVFAGYIEAKAYINTTPSVFVGFDTKNLYQLGIIGAASIAPNTNVWGQAAAGPSWTNYEFGIGYEIIPHLELNVSYRDVCAKNLYLQDMMADAKAKGYGLGLTYKF